MKKGNPRLPCMILRKKKNRIYNFHSPPKRSKGTRQKKIIPILTRFAVELPFLFFFFLLSCLLFTEALLYRISIPIFSLLLLFLLTWYSAVCYVFVCFWQHETLRDNKDTTSTYILARETSQLLINQIDGFHWGWKEMKKKKRVKKERQVLDRLQKKEWSSRHLLRRNPSPP